MAAQLIDLNQSVTSCDATGGIVYSWLVEAKFVTAITVGSGIITNFTMTTTGKWKKWVYDKDNTSNYAETGSRTGKRRPLAQDAFMKFGAIDSAIAIATSDALLTCDIIAIHVLTNGTRLVQGLEIDAAATGGYSLSKIEQTLLQVSRFTDTAQNEARTEFTLHGAANTPSPPTDLTDSELLAL